MSRCLSDDIADIESQAGLRASKTTTRTTTAAAATTTSSNNNNNTPNNNSETSGNGIKRPSISSTMMVANSTSFTSESPYLDAFCNAEMQSMTVMGETLQNIAEKARNLTRTGLIMCEASQRLAQCCKLRGDENWSLQQQQQQQMMEQQQKSKQEIQQMEEDQYQHRRMAVGEDMAQLLQIVGTVREQNGWVFFLFS